MAKQCVITNKQSKIAGGYSNRTRATEFNPTGTKRRKANVHKKRIFVPELGRHVTVNISTEGMKTINKKGAYRALKDAGVIS